MATFPVDSVSGEHVLVKRDPSGVPADILTEGCALKNLNFSTGSHGDPGIQLGECYINSR